MTPEQVKEVIQLQKEIDELENRSKKNHSCRLGEGIIMIICEMVLWLGFFFGILTTAIILMLILCIVQFVSDKDCEE